MMYKLLFPFAMFILFLGCSQDDLTNLDHDGNQLVAMNVFCQRALEDTFKRVEYRYSDDRLTTEITMQAGEISNRKDFEYNSFGLLSLEINDNGYSRSEKSYRYNRKRQLTNIIYKRYSYDSNGQLINMKEQEAPLEYKSDRLVKEWQYWGGFITYEYNRKGQVITKVDHAKDGSKHHITKYKYLVGLKIEERKETSFGSTIYIRNFEYDSGNRLITVVEGENIIEENEYSEGRLTEKRTYYYGIDPCFDPCCGWYIYQYEFN